MQYEIDPYGKWEVNGVFRTLIEPSEIYIKKLQEEEEVKAEQEKIESLIPSESEIQKAETELQMITLLQEVNLI